MSTAALFIGIYLSSLINVTIDVDPQIIMTTFLLTTMIFLCFTLSALLTQKRIYLYLGDKKNRGQRTNTKIMTCFFKFRSP